MEKRSDVRGAYFHFESSGHAVEGLHSLAGQILAVLVQVDEAGSNDEATRVNDVSPTEWGGGDAGDLSVANAYVPHSVQRSLGVDEAAAFQDEIVLLSDDEVCRE